MDFDVAWCPGCDRQISPRRLIERIMLHPIPPPPPELLPPPVSPTRLSKKKLRGKARQTVLRNHQIHLQYRIANHLQPNIQPMPAPQPTEDDELAPFEHGPIGLYCSDECYHADLDGCNRGTFDEPTERLQRPKVPSLIDTPAFAKFASIMGFPPNTPMAPLDSAQRRSTRSRPADISTHTSEQLLASFSNSFTRRPESSLSSSSSSSSISEPRSPRRERNLVHKDAVGKLLVRDVKLKYSVNSSSSSLSSTPPLRSPLSASSEGASRTKRPVIETRSWSYDNVKTYPAMPLALKKIKVLQKQIVDGKEVEVEVEVLEKPKCLFNFAPSVSPPSR